MKIETKGLTSSISTVLEHLPNYLKVKGLSPALAAGIVREIIAKPLRDLE